MHGSHAGSGCLSLFLSRRILICVCSPSSMKLLMKFPLTSVGFGIPQLFFPSCLHSFSMCSALVSHSAFFSSPSTSILVSLKDDRGTEIALSAAFRGVILWFPGESKLASSLLVSPFFLWGPAPQETIFNQTTATELAHIPPSPKLSEWSHR